MSRPNNVVLLRPAAEHTATPTVRPVIRMGGVAYKAVALLKPQILRVNVRRGGENIPHSP